MPNISRPAPHSAAARRRAKASPRLAAHAHPRRPAAEPADTASTEFALTRLNDEFARLQQRLSRPAHAERRQPVVRIAQLHQGMAEAIAAGSQSLARACDGLHALIEPLAVADECPLPASRLLGLLNPLHKQLTRSWGQFSQLL